MIKKIIHTECKHCGSVIAKPHRNQMFCNAICSFESKIIKNIDPSKCWEWNGAKHGFGYGEFRFKDIKYRAHVFSFDLHKGARVKGQQVNHICDNPSCCNPSHLFSGDQASNMKDMSQKGRHGKAKLNRKDVKDIRDLLDKKMLTQLEISKIYGVSRVSISDLKCRKTYKHII